MARVKGSGTPETLIGAGAAPVVQARDVILDDAGANPAAVVEVVRSMTGLELSAARELVARAPCAIRTRIAPALADVLRVKLVAAGATVEVREHGAAPVARELCDVFLRDMGESRADVVHAVKQTTGLGLREAAALVDAAPVVVKRNVERDEAETIVHELVEAGAVAELRTHGGAAPEPPARASEPAAAASSGLFEVILQRCGPNKISVIKAIRAVTGLGLKEAVDIVESSGAPVKRDIPEHEALAIQRELAEAGATVELRGPGAAPATPSAPRATSAAFDIVLRDCGANKIAVIKLIRELTNLGLKDAKDMAETPGSTVKEAVGRAEAARLERQFVDTGAVVELRPREGYAGVEGEPAVVDVFLQLCGPNKIHVIKEVRALTGLGLKETKDLVESAPCMIKEQVDGDEAREIQRRLVEFGAVVELRG